MIQHYLKVAIRNLLKYKVQTGISMLGLAAGFICFVLSAFWIHYERTYDQFRKDADRLYLVRVNDGFAEGRITWRVPVPLGAYLQEHFPEIESFAHFSSYEYRVNISNIEIVSLKLQCFEVLQKVRAPELHATDG